MPDTRNEQDPVLGKMIRISFLLFGLVLLLFVVAWQNIRLHDIRMTIEQRARHRDRLEKELYLMRLELADLESRERIGEMARREGMEQVTYRDVKIIVY